MATEQEKLLKLAEIQTSSNGKPRRLMLLWKRIPPQFQEAVWRAIEKKIEICTKYDIHDLYTPVLDILEDGQNGVIINSDNDNQVLYGRSDKSQRIDEVVAEGSESG